MASESISYPRKRASPRPDVIQPARREMVDNWPSQVDTSEKGSKDKGDRADRSVLLQWHDLRKYFPRELCVLLGGSQRLTTLF